MAEFRTLYYGPMDREYHEAISETPKELAIEEPIMTVSELGETVPEHDPAGRFKNIIQTTQAAIRGGAGTIQIVLQTPIESAIGGRPKAYGKEVRETLKEVAMANELNIAGVEMPTSLNNLAGFDYQQLRFSDEKRKQSLDEVKDAIRFVADVGRGGGVDIVSWEFPRQINDADFQPIEEKKKTFENEGEQRIGYLVDERDGRTQQFRKDEIQHLPYDPKTFKHLREEITEEMLEEPRKIELKQFVWEDFVRWAEYNKGENKKQGLKEGDEDFGAETPEEQFFKVQIEGQITTMKGWRTHYADRARNARKLLDGAQEGLREAGDDPVRREVAVKEVRKYEDEYEDYLSTAHGQAQQAAELQERVKHLKPIKKYAMKRSTRTYAEAGVAAMNEYELGRQKGTVTKPLYVGPEIGWPQYFGSHPDEFIKLIKDSRKEFVDLITKPMMEVSDPVLGTKSKPSPYFDSKITREKAEELSKKHVKGLFDTGHMGMWLSHFKPITDEKTGKLETEDVRIERFGKWFKKEVQKIIDADVVGGIQLVDSMSGAHGHLPPGEGIFPVMETAKMFKKSGFSGFMVSEGHEEEKFGEGRIRMKTWQHAGAPVGAGYFSGPPMQWGQVQQGYFGKTYSPLFMFGGYSPSNEFKLWSEVPLE